MWQPHRQVPGGSRGDPALAKHCSPARALRSLPAPGHSGERQEPRERRPAHPSTPEGMRCQLGRRQWNYSAKRDAASVRGSPPLPLTTEYP